MVVLLVVMAVMAVGMSALLPTWRQQAIRDKEDELVFRGNQYARALVLYSRKNGNQLPNNIEVLYTGKYLRKKYKDPITEDDFGLLPAGQPPGAAGRGSTGGTPAGGRGTQQQPGSARGSGSGLGAPSGTQVVASIQGVYSKSTDTSIRIYQNQQRYIDWPFTVQTAQLQMGTARGAGPGGQQGGRGDGRGGVQGPGRGDGRGGVQGPGRGDGRGRGMQPGGPGRGGTPGAPTGGRGRGGRP